MRSPSAVAERRSFGERLVGGPEGLRRLLERLGPTFIKIGQWLALRPDLIPQEYSDELLRLLDDVEAVPWREVEAVIREDLGDPRELFRSINPRPTAAGSMAQVHQAVLRDGTRVAVKVLRPGIAARVRADLRRARTLARVLRLTHVDLIASPQELVEELQAWLEMETDLRNELSHIGRLRDLTRNSDIQIVPKPYPNLCSRRVLTAEYVSGLPFLELLRIADEGGQEEVHRRGLELRLDELADNLIHATLVQIFRYQFFHADLHPGNLIALSGNAIGYVDFGLCYEIDETVRREQVRYLSMVYEGNVPQLFQALLDVLTPGENADTERFRADFIAECTKWLGRADEDYGDGAEPRSPIANCLIAVVRAARRNRFLIPARLLAMYRALLTAEAVAHRMAPGASLRSVGRQFFVSLRVDDTLDAISPEAQRTLLPKVIALLRDSPGPIQQLLSEIGEGRFKLRTENSEDAATRRLRNARTRLLAGAILSVGLAFVAAAPVLPALGRMPLRPFALAGLILLYGSILLQWRRLK